MVHVVEFVLGVNETAERELASEHLKWPAKWTAVGVTQIGGGMPGVRIEIRVLAFCPVRSLD